MVFIYIKFAKYKKKFSKENEVQYNFGDQKKFKKK